MARVLVMPTGVGSGLAHAGACHTVAADLAARGHDAILAYGGHLPELLPPGPHRVVKVPELHPKVIHELNRFYPEPRDLEKFVRSDRELMERECPDVVISDFRPSAAIAAHDAGIPDIGLCHFLGFSEWSTAAQLPGRRWARRARHPVMAFGRWWDGRHRDGRVAEGLDAIVNGVRRTHGMQPVFNSLSMGRVVACTSTPLLDPARGMPPEWRYVGHISWSAGGPVAPLPEPSEKPLVYVTQGSTGRAESLFRAVRDLARLPVDVLVSTATLCDPADIEALAPNVTAARYLPGRECLERSSVAVIHGGHMTSSDAHLTGTPVVVVPAAADHWIWAARVQRMGTGIPVEGPLMPGRIRRAVVRTLHDESYRARMTDVATELAAWDAGANVDKMVCGLARR